MRRRRGAARSIIGCRRFAPSPSRMRCIGCANTASTGCGWMRCTPSLEPGEISMLHDLSRAVGNLAAETGRHIHLVLENDDNAASLLDAERRSAARQISRAVERRLSSRLACAADRRDAGLLPRLRDVAAARYRARAGVRLCLSGRSLRASRRAIARRTERRALADRLCQFPAEPRPDRQPRARRPARKPCATPRRSKPRWRSPCWRRRSRCCSWARNGARKRRSRSSAISRAISPKPCARAGAGNSPGPMPNTATRFPIRWTLSTFQSAVLDWDARNAAAGRKRLALVRELLAIRRREIVPRLAGATFGDAHAADDGLLTAHWRMGDGATLSLTGQSVRSRAIAHPAGEIDRHPDLGRR